MGDIYNLIFSIFSTVIKSMKSVYVFDNVDLVEFFIGLTVITIVCVAFVSVIHSGAVGSSNYEIYDKQRHIGFGSDIDKKSKGIRKRR